MHYLSTTLHLTTTQPIELVDITPLVKQFIDSSHLQQGLLTIMSRHTTACININEHEEQLIQDMLEFLSTWVPRHRPYQHNAIDDRGNAHSHLMALCMNASQTLPLINGQLVLGTWQSIFFVELDGPRSSRQVVLHLMGAKNRINRHAG